MKLSFCNKLTFSNPVPLQPVTVKDLKFKIHYCKYLRFTTSNDYFAKK